MNPSTLPRPRVHYTQSLDEADFGSWAEAAFAIAAERQTAALKVRDAVLAALDCGDVASARDLVERWTVEAIEEIAKDL